MPRNVSDLARARARRRDPRAQAAGPGFPPSRPSFRMRAACFPALQKFRALLPSAKFATPKVSFNAVPRIQFQAHAVPLAAMSALTANRLAVVTTTASVASMARPIGVRFISSSQACRSIDDFFVSQPQVDKDGKIMYPSVGTQVNSTDLMTNLSLCAQVEHGPRLN